MQPLFNPKHLQNLAALYGLRPSRNYGQNFLMDEAVIQKIVSLSGADQTDTVVEVGPGFGVLTLALAEKAGRVLSFEIEKKLQPYWDEVKNKYPNIEVVWGNVLRMFPEQSRSLPEHYKVIANLPYQITSAAVRMFLESPRPPAKLTLMVQKEVAERICAKPGDMSLLSVSVQYYAEPRLELVVPSSAFWPAPKVDSAVITLKRFPGLTAQPEELFFRLVKAGFSNRRKLLVKNIEHIAGKKKKNDLLLLFDRLGILKTARAQELSVAKWRELVAAVGELLKN
jgi:16S rRNA (adenine1518-N6/adenine1519-N6)-dimethyltransferase